MKKMMPRKEDVVEARERVGPFIHKTPVMTCKSINEKSGADLFFKCENLQKGGSFKIRGAMNAVLSLSPKKAEKGVATHSSGNHAQALALAARMRSVPCHVVMPETSPEVKIEAVRSYGAKITFCKPTLEDREKTLGKIVKKTGAEFIHPYDDVRTVTGQATCGKELLEQVPGLDCIVVPVGGGGLCSGTCLSAEYFSSGTRVWGIEPDGADDAKRSLEKGEIVPSVNPETIADGLLTSLGEITFPIIRDLCMGIKTVTDDEIRWGMELLFSRAKTVVEPSGAVSLAGVLSHKEVFEGKRVGVVLSGGNVDLKRLPF